jgi:hypothetical protein
MWLREYNDGDDDNNNNNNAKKTLNKKTCTVAEA